MVAHWSALVHMDLVQIGSTQLITPDADSAVPLPCCAMENGLGIARGANRIGHPECFPIVLSSDDPKYRGMINCMDYARTLPAPRTTNCSLGAREQANQATSFLDASFLYGSSAQRNGRLRSFRDGKLLADRENGLNSQARQLPPNLEMLGVASSKSGRRGGNARGGWGQCVNGVLSTCFGAGTGQVNFLPSLAALDTLFLRQHNSVAAQLLALNKAWSDEQLFQETRRIVIAQLQHITFNEWLPLLIGREEWHRAGLHPMQPKRNKETTTQQQHADDEEEQEEDDYSLGMDPTTLNEYASAAGLFFLTMFESRFAHLEPNGIRSMDRPLSEWMYEVERGQTC